MCNARRDITSDWKFAQIPYLASIQISTNCMNLIRIVAVCVFKLSLSICFVVQITVAMIEMDLIKKIFSVFFLLLFQFRIAHNWHVIYIENPNSYGFFFGFQFQILLKKKLFSLRNIENFSKDHPKKMNKNRKRNIIKIDNDFCFVLNIKLQLILICGCFFFVSLFVFVAVCVCVYIQLGMILNSKINQCVLVISVFFFNFHHSINDLQSLQIDIACNLQCTR